MRSGILNVHKPAGVTSHDVVDFVRRLLPRGEKVGHTGTLDPAATGVLVLCLGRATRLAEYLGAGRKRYRAKVLLDRTTSTGDLEGEVAATFDRVAPPEEVATAVRRFTGPILQRPHRVSAVKIGGRRLYERARAGEVPDEIPARPIQIHEIQILDYQYPRLELDVECSAGTYIRQLAEDLGEALGTGGCLEELIRTRVGSLRLEESRTLFELASMHVRGGLEEVVLSPAVLLDDFGEGRVGPAALSRISHGQSLALGDLESFRAGERGELVKMLAGEDDLVAIYRLGAGDRLEPCKVLL